MKAVEGEKRGKPAVCLDRKGSNATVAGSALRGVEENLQTGDLKAQGNNKQPVREDLLISLLD